MQRTIIALFRDAPSPFPIKKCSEIPPVTTNTYGSHLIPPGGHITNHDEITNPIKEMIFITFGLFISRCSKLNR